MSTCNWLDLQTLGSQLVMPKNLPDHCSRHRHGHFNIGHDLTLNLGSYPLLNKISYIKVAWLLLMKVTPHLDLDYIYKISIIKTKISTR